MKMLEMTLGCLIYMGTRNPGQLINHLISRFVGKNSFINSPHQPLYNSAAQAVRVKKKKKKTFGTFGSQISVGRVV